MSNMKVATPKAVRTAASDMSDAFLKCRDLGHNWRLYYQQKIGRGFERKLFCPSCKTNKHVIIDKTGDITSTKYDYDTGYQFKGLGRVMGNAKSTLRLESINRMTDIDESVDQDELVNEL